MLGHNRLPLAALLLCLLFGASAARADDNGATVAADLCRSYPRRTAELEKWLERQMVPCQTTPDEVVAIFGRRYHHPRVGCDAHGNWLDDPSAYAYGLDELGVCDGQPFDILVFHFDAQTRRLVRAAVEEREERQTGFHLETSTGQ